MHKAADAFRSIGEVSRLVGVPPHVLRYWETQFPQLAPVKRADGRRYYRPEDLHLAAGLCELLREDGMTTRGAARLIAKDKGAALRARGLARLPERFRGEAAALADWEGAAEGREPTDEAMTEPRSASERADAGAEDGNHGPAASEAGEVADSALADTPGADQAATGEAAPPAAAAAVATGSPPAEDATPQPGPSSAQGAAEPEAVTPSPAEPHQIASTTAAAEPASGGVQSAETTPATPVTATPAPLPGTGDGRSEAAMAAMAERLPTAPAAAATETPPAEAAPAESESAPRPQAAPAAAGEDTPRRPAPPPRSTDLPLFPGLAPAAPPPGVWLPRLASTAEALRAMPPPRRPTVQMQRLRDRVAALLDAGN